MGVAVEDRPSEVERDHRIDALEAEVASVCGVINAAEGRLVSLIAEALAEGLWAQGGVWSPEGWVAWRCGVSSSRAWSLVAIARRHDELPVLAGAVQAGELSVDQAAVVARRCPTGFDEAVVEVARLTTVGQLGRALRVYGWPEEAQADPRVTPADPNSSEAQPVSFGSRGRGRWGLGAELPEDRGAVVQTALEQARRDLFLAACGPDVVDDGTGRDVTWADALVSVAESYLDHGKVTGSGPDRFRVHLHLEADPEANPVASFPMATAPLPGALGDLVCCDSTIVPVWERHGTPLAYGRAKRIVPEPLRREVLRRDDGCVVPGCSNTRFLQIHHVIRWKDGGRTEAWNLAAVCHAHHRADHEGRITISGRADDPGGFRVTMPHGQVLPQHAQPVPPTGPVADAAARLLGRPPPTYRNPIGERLDLHWLDLHPNRPPPAPPQTGPGPDPPHPN